MYKTAYCSISQRDHIAAKERINLQEKKKNHRFNSRICRKHTPLDVSLYVLYKGQLYNAGARGSRVMSRQIRVYIRGYN